tara:strand:- start:127 stop:390 length:264 start_codon:yes stop_codon:yes gene_type:complete
MIELEMRVDGFAVGYMDEWVYNIIWPILEKLPQELLNDLMCERSGSHKKYLELMGPVLNDLPKNEITELTESMLEEDQCVCGYDSKK